METRILAKGIITDLSQGFNLGGTPFSLYLRSKAREVENDTIIRCKLICDKTAGAFPVPVGDWTPALISAIPPNGIDTAKYEIYWGASSNPQKL